jgi:hypothetical protein
MNRTALIAAACLLAASACGSVIGQHTDHQYTVAAVVQVSRDQTALACFPDTLLAASYLECTKDGGIPVVGFDTAGVTRTNTFADGAFQTTPRQLTGTWSNNKLILDRSSTPASKPTGFLLHSGVAGEPSAETRHNYDRLNSDYVYLRDRGYWILDTSAGTDGLVVMVVAADPSTIDYLQHQYGAKQVLGWLRPA